jgi:hypothetical protein
MKVQQRRSRGSTTTTIRKSLPLSTRDIRDLALLRSSAARRGALAELAEAEIDESVSEAQLLHAVLEAGLRAVELQIEEEGYAADAANQRAEDIERRTAARRRSPRWSDEP